MEKSPKADLLVVGDLNIDFLGMIPFLPEADEEVVVDPLESYLGGSGANFSVIATRLGLKVSFYSAIGKDANGQALLTLVKENGVSTDHIKLVKDLPTGMVFGVIEPSGIRRLFCFRGANLNLFPDDISDEEIATVRWLHLNGPEFNLAVDLLNRGRKLKIPTSMDPGSILIEEHNIDEILSLSDVLFLNEVEFQKLSEGNNYLKRADDLHQKGVNWVVVKHGSLGSVVFRENQQPIVQNAFEIQAVDSTGAGDAFNAGFLFGILRDIEISETLIFANAVGALTTLAVGATTGVPNSVSEIEHFITHTNQKKDQLDLQ